jgi:hypothetical protein
MRGQAQRTRCCGLTSQVERCYVLVPRRERMAGGVDILPKRRPPDSVSANGVMFLMVFVRQEVLG